MVFVIKRQERQFAMDTPSHPSITLSAEQRIENGVVYTDDVARQRAIAY